MRVALTHVFGWPEVRRGAERLVGELAPALAEAGAEVTVFSSAYDHGTERDGSVTYVRFRRRHEHVPSAEWHFGRRVFPALVTGRYDIVHSFGRHDGSASVRAARVHPRRVTVHTDIGLPVRAQWNSRPADGRIMAKVIERVDVYGCMSEASLRCLREDYGREGTLLPGGVDVAAFRPGPRLDRPTILFPAAIDVPRKGLAPLLEAMPLVAAEVPDVRLLVCGPGDPAAIFDQAPAEARALAEVVSPALDELPALYSSAWACALPSENDTFGLVLVEALAAGTPIVAGNSQALPELVDVGSTGSICEPFDVESIARACVEALRLGADPATAARCRTSAERFDWRSAVAPRHLDVYRQALTRRAPNRYRSDDGTR